MARRRWSGWRWRPTRTTSACSRRTTFTCGFPTTAPRIAGWACATTTPPIITSSPHHTTPHHGRGIDRGRTQLARWMRARPPPDRARRGARIHLVGKKKKSRPLIFFFNFVPFGLSCLRHGWSIVMPLIAHNKILWRRRRLVAYRIGMGIGFLSCTTSSNADCFWNSGVWFERKKTKYFKLIALVCTLIITTLVPIWFYL